MDEWAKKCLPEYFTERKQFILDTNGYFTAICGMPDSFDAGVVLGQCYQKIDQSSYVVEFKACHENLMASIHKSASERGPNHASRWTTGTVIKDHCWYELLELMHCFFHL